jgi:hypothetical protein
VSPVLLAVAIDEAVYENEDFYDATAIKTHRNRDRWLLYMIVDRLSSRVGSPQWYL